MDGPVDLLVVGGGINGTGIARDAAGCGLSVVLCEQDDLAAATSSASSKLIHGGLRYLEHREFRLVRESLAEREVLLHSAPHIIRPLRFVLPHHDGLRPAWMLRAGLFLYDHLGWRPGVRSHLPPTRTLHLRTDPAGVPLRPAFRLGFAYSDCWVEDSRLVVLTALDAAERGARILTRTRLAAARRAGDVWEAELEDAGTGRRTPLRARALVNAAGPWVASVQALLGWPAGRRVRLVKGSHIVVPRLYEGEQAYTLQNADGRIVFVIPYEGAFSLIGTTDVPVTGDPGTVTASAEETAYLCGVVADYFERPPTPADVVWSFAGVRPLHDDGSADASAVTRDYALDLDGPADGQEDGPPLLTVHGGKLTTFRRLAEDALVKLMPRLGRQAAPWTEGATLPGGDIPDGDVDRFEAETARRYPFLPPAMRHRLCRAYGTRIARVLGDARSLAALGRDFGGVTEAELDHLRREEWARTGEDVLWRRSRLGLHLDADAMAGVGAWFAGERAPAPIPASARPG
ncbi:glycerol-3-phosphate dehydrogenase [Rhodospirillum centenum]|uniref:Glycerol-3-phosphate dehydrogenase n=1 Tax=Rhodospirillum centenum (strain ATCC 51521 / SW) TaxID=414684 RepID=B6IQH7_RHOCS|nr:glycerol-3-phosphate dehydrogenase [Rhodospirillum centenum]ACI97713.1 glycerol-3-phosphate dehydrogenase [Rhodospirillum centenum SW]